MFSGSVTYKLYLGDFEKRTALAQGTVTEEDGRTSARILSVKVDFGDTPGTGEPRVLECRDLVDKGTYLEIQYALIAQFEVIRDKQLGQPEDWHRETPA